MMKHKIIEITKTSELFPPALLAIGNDCPEKLYLMGNVDLLKQKKNVAIIGARAADRKGYDKAYSLAADFAKMGYVVVSGLALGCDSAAHRGCLAAHGKTIAIVGSGLDIVHPVVNKDLQEMILNHDGLVISEYPLGVKATPKNLVLRNRLQAALSPRWNSVTGRWKARSTATMKMCVKAPCASLPAARSGRAVLTNSRTV